MSSDRPIAMVLLIAIFVVVMVIGLDTRFPSMNVASIASAVISIFAAFLAILQFREEAKISIEITNLGTDSELQRLTKLQREAVLRHKRKRKRALENRRLFIVVIVVVMIAVAEIVGCFSAIMH